MSNQKFHFRCALSTEELAKKLSQDLQKNRSPLRTEQVLLMNSATKNWLQQDLATRNKICCNINFCTPEKLFSTMFQGAKNYQATEIVMTWYVFDYLLQHANDDDKLFNYCANKPEQLFLLAEKLSNLFWKYQLVRPEMLNCWKNNNLWIPENLQEKNQQHFLSEQEKQKNVWRECNFQDFLEQSQKYADFLITENLTEEIIQSLPPRIFVFNVTTMVKIHWELLQKLSKYIDIYFYFHELSDDLWVETQNEKYASLKQRRDTSVEYGNPLLTAWGKGAVPFVRSLIDNEFYEYNYNDDDFAPQHFLQNLQYQIRKNHNVPNSNIAADDSFKIAVTHSKMREVQTIYHEIVNLVHNKNYNPRDIVIMSPKISDYAPYIKAVFDLDDPIKFNYTIADQNANDCCAEIKAFQKLISFSQSRCLNSEAVYLFSQKPIQDKLEFTSDDLRIIINKINDSNINWGIDNCNRLEIIHKYTAQREEIDNRNNPSLGQGTWEFGFKSLAQNYLIGENICLDRANPLLHIEKNINETTAHLLSKIYYLLLIIDEFKNKAKNSHTIDEWTEILETLAHNIIAEDIDNPKGFTELINSIKLLGETAREAQFKEEVPFKVVLNFLELNAWSATNSSNLLQRGLTFCQMQPLRNIPAKAIFIIGLNDNNYPRRDTALNFDLTNIHKIPWDRSKRDEDCLLFLETILSAREFLHLSYQGRSEINNSVIPPSIILNELREFALLITQETAINETLSDDEIKEREDIQEGKIAASFEVIHRLHEFSEDYFMANKEKFYNFRKADFEAAKVFIDKNKNVKVESKVLELPPINEQEHLFRNNINISSIINCFCDPASYIVDNRFDYSEPVINNEDLDSEIFNYTKLDESNFFYRFVNQLLAQELCKNDIASYPDNISSKLLQEHIGNDNIYKAIGQTFEYFKKTNKYIDATLPEFLFNKIFKDFAYQLIAFKNDYISTPKEIEIILDNDKSITANINNCLTSPNNEIITIHSIKSSSSLKAKNQLKIFLHHILLSAYRQQQGDDNFNYKSSFAIQTENPNFILHYDKNIDYKSILTCLLEMYYDILNNPFICFDKLPSELFSEISDNLYDESIKNKINDLINKDYMQKELCKNSLIFGNELNIELDNISKMLYFYLPFFVDILDIKNKEAKIEIVTSSFDEYCQESASKELYKKTYKLISNMANNLEIIRGSQTND